MTPYQEALAGLTAIAESTETMAPETVSEAAGATSTFATFVGEAHSLFGKLLAAAKKAAEASAKRVGKAVKTKVKVGEPSVREDDRGDGLYLIVTFVAKGNRDDIADAFRTEMGSYPRNTEESGDTVFIDYGIRLTTF